MSTLKNTLEADKVTAMREAGTATEDTKGAAVLKLSTLRALISAISASETSGKERISLDDDAILAVLRNQYKRRIEAADMYTTAGATERATKERAEAAIINAYLPQMLDEDATRDLITALIAETGATGPKGMGLVMKALGASGRTDVDKGVASKVARELL